MMEDRRQQSGHACSDDYADQPKTPGSKEGCEDLKWNSPPTLKDLTRCEPDPKCGCEKPPGSTSNCLEDLIAKQAAKLVSAEKEKAFKTELEGFLQKAKAATQDYTREKYDKLIEQWKKQDEEIVELIRKLVCAVPCWRCVIECHICPLIYELRFAKDKLYGDGTRYTEVHDLYDMQYWWQRERELRERQLLRMKKVLAAWEKPTQTIEKVLNDIKGLIEAACKSLCPESGKVVVDVFLKIVPLHLAVSPPKSVAETRIAKEYTELCTCDKGTSDDCCGPDVGELSLFEQLLGPQPYLIDPSEYFKVICCLVEKRYEPAQVAAAKAEAEWTTIGNQIKGYQAQLENWTNSFEKTAKGAVPSVVKCCGDRMEKPEKSS